MKKILIVLALLLCLCTLVSCEDSYKSGEFYTDEFLSQNGLTGIPVPPKIENSVIKNESYLYLNLTKEEYGQYVREIVSYLRQKEDIHYLGYSVGGYLLAEIVPYDKIAPFTDSYDVSLDEHEMFFSLEDELGSDDQLKDPIKILISRESGNLKYNNFAYNTEICILTGTFINAKWDLCGAEHTYDDGVEYKIPGGDDTLTEYTCINCGSTKFSKFIGDMKTYSVTIVDTDADGWILDRNKNCISGVIRTTTVEKHIDKAIKITVNGTEILPRETEDGKLSYDFIMPCSDVVIIAEFVETEETE